MSCPILARIDLDVVLADRSGDEWRSFSAHYPQCEECRAATEHWEAMTELLQQAGEHLPPAILRDYQQGAVSVADAKMVEAHIRHCRHCERDLATLARFAADLEAEARQRASETPPVTSTERSVAPARPALPQRADDTPSWLDRLGGWLWQPALAYGIMVVVTGASVFVAMLPPVLPDNGQLGLESEITLRAAEPTRLRISDGANDLRIPLAGEVTATRFRISVRDEAGSVLLDRTVRRASSASPSLSVSLPVEWLRPGRYSLEVAGLGASPTYSASFELSLAP